MEYITMFIHGHFNKQTWFIFKFLIKNVLAAAEWSLVNEDELPQFLGLYTCQRETANDLMSRRMSVFGLSLSASKQPQPLSSPPNQIKMKNSASASECTPFSEKKFTEVSVGPIMDIF